MTKTSTNKNPLRAALDDLKARGTRDVVRALVDATDRQLERHHIHGWAREGSFPPAAESRALLDVGLKRLGLKRGLPEATWAPWIRVVKRQRAETDKRNPAVRERLGLPAFRGKPGGTGGRAPMSEPPAPPVTE